MKLILILGLLTAGIAWYKLSPSKEAPKKKTPVVHRGLTYGELQRIKNDSAREMEIQKERVRLQNQVLTPRVQGRPGRKESVPHVVDIQPNSGALDTDIASPRDLPTLDGEMNKFLAEKQRFQALQIEKKKAFAKQFVRQAREMGYDVKIDKDMQITEVRKLQRGRSR